MTGKWLFVRLSTVLSKLILNESCPPLVNTPSVPATELVRQWAILGVSAWFVTFGRDIIWLCYSRIFVHLYVCIVVFLTEYPRQNEVISLHKTTCSSRCLLKKILVLCLITTSPPGGYSDVLLAWINTPGALSGWGAPGCYQRWWLLPA